MPRCFTPGGGGIRTAPALTLGTRESHNTKEVTTMGYGIGGILVLILVILAIVYFAKRV